MHFICHVHGPGPGYDSLCESDVFLASGDSCKPSSKMAALSEYENAMFLELMDDDGLFVTAK